MTDVRQPSVALRRARAYAILGIAPNSVIAYPKITPVLKKIPGGLDYAIECLRSSDSPDARQFLSIYDDIRMPKMCRETLPLEAFAIASGLSASRVMGAIVSAAHVAGAQLGTLIAALNHPRIVEASVAAGMMPDGEKDREMQLKHMEFLPQPRGAQVNVRTTVNATAQSTSAAASALAPPPEDTIRRLTDSFNAWRPDALAAPPTLDALPPAPIEDVGAELSVARRKPSPIPAFASMSADYDEERALDAELSAEDDA